MVSVCEAVGKLRTSLDFSGYPTVLLLVPQVSLCSRKEPAKFRKLSQKVSARRGKHNPDLQFLQTGETSFTDKPH